MKKVLGFFKKPPVWFLLPEYAVAVASVVSCFILISQGQDGIPTYVLYGVSAVTFSYMVYTLIAFAAKDVKNGIAGKLHSTAFRHTFTRRLYEDYEFRTVFFSFLTFFIAVAFCVFYTVLAVYYHTVWYAAFAGYDFILSLIRIMIVIMEYTNRHKSEEDKKRRRQNIYVFSGFAMIVFDLTMIAPVVLMMQEKRPLDYEDWMIYAIAAYTFYKIIMASVNLVKSGKVANLVVKSLRSINIATAMISLMSLETIMIMRFSENNPDMKTLSLYMGFIILAACIGLAFYIIVRGIYLKKHPQTEGENENE